MKRFPVAVTGGIATGKSTALARFAYHGFKVASADDEVRRLWDDPVAAQRLAHQLGVEWPLVKGALRSRLFEPGFRARVADVMHPIVLDSLAARSPQVVELPLAVESCVLATAGVLVVTDCPRQVQLDRLAFRLGSQTDAFVLLRSQLPNAVRRAFADFVVPTENGIEAATRHVDQIVKCLRAGLAEAKD